MVQRMHVPIQEVTGIKPTPAVPAVLEQWVQHAVKAQRLTLHKEDGQSNPADLMTKSLERKLLEYLMEVTRRSLAWWC